MRGELIAEISRHAEDRSFPDGLAYRSLAVAAVVRLSAAFDLPGVDIELAALGENVVPERYARNLRTFTLEDQAALLRSTVLVVGLGGLGGVVTEILARVGVGRLRLVDGDRFEDSNLNRQFLSSCAGLGSPKAEAARQRVTAVNPSIAVEVDASFFDPHSGGRLLADAAAAVDCLDNLKSRFVLEAACKASGCPLVSAAVAGATGHVTTIFPEDKGLRLIYGDPKNAPLKGAETSLGTVPYAVTALAAIECAEVVKIIRGKGDPLRDKLLVGDFNAALFDVLSLA